MHALPVQEVDIRLGKGEHRRPDFERRNPLHHVPFFEDDNFGLPESCAILVYLVEKFPGSIRDHWYPSDPKMRSAVIALMHWHHISLRSGIIDLTVEYIVRSGRGEAPRLDIVYKAYETIKEGLDVIENIFLKDTTFCSIPSTGTSIGRLPSLGDLMISCELESLILLKHLPTDEKIRNLHDFEDYPKIAKYMTDIRRFCQPHYDDVSAALFKVTEAQKRRSKM